MKDTKNTYDIKTNLTWLLTIRILTGMTTAERLRRRTQTKTFNKRSTCFGKHSKNRRESSVTFVKIQTFVSGTKKTTRQQASTPSTTASRNKGPG